jgi:hypothetical protein
MNQDDSEVKMEDPKDTHVKQEVKGDKTEAMEAESSSKSSHEPMTPIDEGKQRESSSLPALDATLPSPTEETSAALVSSSHSMEVSTPVTPPETTMDTSPVSDTEKWQPQGEGIGLSVASIEPSMEPAVATNGQQSEAVKRPAQTVTESRSGDTSNQSPPKKKKTAVVNPVGSERKSTGSPAPVPVGKDQYCWYCHKEKCVITCKQCPRSFHGKCLTTHNASVPKGSAFILCPECNLVIETEKIPPRALRKVPVEELNDLILMAVNYLKIQADPSFYSPVVTSAYEGYEDKIVYPFCFKDIEDKCHNREYRTPFGFFADIKWILHNCAIYNGNCPLTNNARGFVKIAQNKLYELETCPDCFRNGIEKPKTYFSELCRRPHTLVMSRVQGHPFWPSKLVDINKQTHEADVRFFGGHER